MKPFVDGEARSNNILDPLYNRCNFLAPYPVCSLERRQATRIDMIQQATSIRSTFNWDSPAQLPLRQSTPVSPQCSSGRRPH